MLYFEKFPGQHGPGPPKWRRKNSYASVLYKKLHDFLVDNKVLNRQQWGFISLQSMALALTGCSSNCLLNIDKETTNFTVFFDINKAFVTIDHKILLEKHSYYDISGPKLDLLGLYLENCSQCCCANGKVSFMAMIRYGVPQGSIPYCSSHTLMTYQLVLKMVTLEYTLMTPVYLTQQKLVKI